MCVQHRTRPPEAVEWFLTHPGSSENHRPWARRTSSHFVVRSSNIVSLPTRCREARPCLYLPKTGLLQRALLWDSWQKYTEAAIHPEQRCQGPKESPEIRPHHTNPLLPALAPCLSQDRLQNLGHDPQLHQWTCPPISTRTNKKEKEPLPVPSDQQPSSSLKNQTLISEPWGTGPFVRQDHVCGTASQWS